MFNRFTQCISLIALLVLAACGGGDDEAVCPQQHDIHVVTAAGQCAEPTAADRVRLPAKPNRGDSL